ncbi:MAG: hypothetical protein IJL98_00885, partial [Lachnospiraceae bacterium]|nr:hypothetical protein [Lachnospiraceae bacterium]
MLAAMKERSDLIKEAKVTVTQICNDTPRYEVEDVVQLSYLEGRVMRSETLEEAKEAAAAYKELAGKARIRENAPERIYLWKEGNMPAETDYTDNSDFKYNHNPDFKPYLYEMLIPEYDTPKGMIIVCAGGDHGTSVVKGYEICRSLNQKGYQCLLLLNRPNHMPWNGHECGADSARAVRYARKNAKRFRIKEDNIAFAGFSNGGLTGEALIQFYSGDKKVTDYFPNYVPDELDDISATLNAFVCVYGPRFNGDDSFVWEGTVYPPVFYAIGRLDNAIDNFNFVYPDLLKHNVPVEVHTFAGVPHGQAGAAITKEGQQYPSFDLWVPLADYFLQDIFN